MFSRWKMYILEDQLNTISRLNNELNDRVKFEHRLMDIIKDYEQIILEYENRTNISPDEIFKSICLKNHFTGESNAD